MVKRLCSLVLLLFCTASVYAQLPPGVNMRFFTSFENPNPYDSMTAAGNGGFNVITNLSTPQGSQAVRSGVAIPQLNSTVTLTSNPFATSGQFKVWLDFNHIAKLAPDDSAQVQVSVDGGVSWQTLGVTACIYNGSALAMRSRNSSFSEIDYGTTWRPDFSGWPAIPDNTWWKHERFDISYIAANRPDVRFRFRYTDQGSPGLNQRYGWVIDSVMVTSAFSELVQPVISHTALLGPVYDIDVPISAIVDDGPGCDYTGMGNVWAFFRVNNGALDSVQLPRLGTTLTWRDSIKRPQVADGDTVCYFLRAIDSSPNQNIRYFPNQANPGDSCLTFITSGIPILTHASPLLGLQFSAGPFQINATSRDASGIDSVILYYRLNGGAWQFKSMVKQGTTNNYRDSIFVIDGDTVNYYLESVDLSARRFRTRIPDTAWTFIASGPPTIQWPSTFAEGTIFLGGVFNLGPFNIPVRVTDGSGVDTAILYYTINNGALDSVGMTRLPGSGFVNWTGTVRSVSDSDTVCYYVRSRDASVRNNAAINPSSGCRTFIASSGVVPNYVDNFEGIPLWNAYLGNPSSAGGWILGSPTKSVINAPRSGAKSWVVGPLNADYPTSAFYILESPVFDFSTVVDPTLSFWMHRNIADALNGGDALWIEFTDSVSNPIWERLNSNHGITNNWYNKLNPNAQIPGSAGGYWDGTTPGYQKSEIRLTSPRFQNNPKRIRFRFVFKSNNLLQANGVAIDDISIIRPILVDVNVLGVVNQAGQPFSATQVISGNRFNFGVILRNFGQIPLDSVDVVWDLNNVKDTTRLLFSPALAVNATSTARMLDSVRAGAIDCWSNITVYAIHPLDGNRLNDTTYSTVYGIPVKRFPYLDNFDSTAACNWLPIQIGNNNMPWQLGTPTKVVINSAFSAPNAWVTTLAGNPPGNSQGYLFSPLFDFSRSVNGLLSIRLNRRFATGSGLRISYADENFTNFWQTLGVLNDPNRNSSNWYNGTVAIAAQNGPAFNGISTGYTEHIIELPAAFNYRSNRVRFRVEFGSISAINEGVAFDNFRIYSPPAVDVNLLTINRPVACPDSLKATDTIQVLIKNSGTDTLRGITLNYRFINVANPAIIVNGTAFTSPDTVVPAATRIIQLPGFPSPPAPYGDYTLQVFAVQTGEGRSQNDTLTRCVKTIPPVDLVLGNILAPLPTLCYPAGFVIVKFVVRNIGHSATATYNAYYKLDTLPAVLEVITRPVASNGFDTVQMTVPLRIPIGPASLRIYVNSNLDGRNFNDSATVNLEGLIPYDLPYRETFESFPASQPPPYCYQVFFNNANSQLGLVQVMNNVVSPSNPSDKVVLMGTLSSGATAWTNTFNPWANNYQPLFLTRMVLPVLTDSRPNIHIRFRLLQVAGVNNLFSFLRVLANGVEVQRYQPTVATPPTNPFQTYDLDLSSFYVAGQPLIIEFQSKCRYAFLQTGNLRNGNVLDDITVYHSVPNSADVDEVSYTPPFPTANTAVTVRARIRNTGQTVLNSVTVAAQVNGTPLQTVNFQPGLAFLQDSVLTFTTTFQPLVGSNGVCVTSSQPNGQPDNYTLDDTSCVDAIGFDVISNFPYCNDFDQGQPAWLTLNPFTLRASQSTWVFGTPQKGHINGAASGTKAWYIGVDSVYGELENSALYSPIFDLQSDSCYQIEFSSKWLTDFFDNDTTDAPLSGDGGTVEYSTNGGADWDYLGGIDSISWYVSYIQAMLVQGSVPFLPGLGWSGKSPDNYTRLSHPFNPGAPKQVLFRFRFASDNGFNGEGWSIDDFCFVKISGSCLTTSVQEALKAGFDLRQNYPNPFDRTTTIEYKIPAAGKVDIAVRDMIGRIVATYPQGIQAEGEYSAEIDLGNLNAGVYFYTVSFGGQQRTKKMIISK